MSNQLTTTPASRLTEAEIAELAAAGIIPEKCPPAQVSIFAGVCASVGLDPRLKEIELIPLGGGKYGPYVRKDGLRKIASRTGDFAGCDPIKFDLLPDGSYKTAAQFVKGQMPATATATVYRFVKGNRCPFTVTVVMGEFYKPRKFENQSPSNWELMPFQMISKVAEAHALRMAFPEVTNGILAEGEIEIAREIASGIPTAPALPELVVGSEKFQQVVKAIADGRAVIAQVWTKFVRTEEAEAAIVQAVADYSIQTV
jgi:phage recombination protein Bet